jgi:hypothetical protein
MYVTDFREKVMFHLKIESTHIPGQEFVFWRKVDRGVELVYGPVVFEYTCIVGQRIIGFLHRVSQLKRNRQNHTSNQVHENKSGKNLQRRQARHQRNTDKNGESKKP